jgi:LCP family protein required for cell wall assembly
VAGRCAAGAVLLAVIGAGFVYFKLDGNIRGIDINAALGTDRPKNIDNGSMDILVLGSDSRSGANQKAGGGVDDGTARSDTAMIVHVYKGHRKAAIVSIPRDTLIDRPKCTGTSGAQLPAAPNTMFNEAYSAGGAVCAVKTVEAMTGIRMDHYIEADFSGFEHLVNAFGGVKLTTAQNIDDNGSHLHLAAGTHTLNGTESLGLVRTRHGVGDGSDLGRIALQQSFMKALIDRINSLGLLADPPKLYDVANIATSALSTDSDLASVQGLVGLAQSMNGLGSKGISMVTMPVTYDATDQNRVVAITAEADQVWATLRADKAIPKSATKGSVADLMNTSRVVRSG